MTERALMELYMAGFGEKGKYTIAILSYCLVI